MRKLTVFLPLALLVTGCVSDSDFAASQLKLAQLSQKVNTLENTVNELQQVVKTQRVVRLPTGASTRMLKRAANQAQNNQEETAYQSAVQLYDSGDTEAAEVAFNEFIRQYPNSSRRNEVLFYLGQAYYAQRRYEEAILPLEALVLQNPQQANPKAVQLLKRLYQLTNRSDKITSLEGLLQNSGPSLQ